MRYEWLESESKIARQMVTNAMLPTVMAVEMVVARSEIELEMKRFWAK